MSKFDLNNPTDFARATMSSGPGGLLSLFTGGTETQWDIQESAYYIDSIESGVIFHVFKTATDYNAAVDQIIDSGGRRKAKFLFPYIDGQLIEDIGRTPESFEVNVLIHGDNYLNAFNSLMQLLNDPRPGTLVHPVRGNITCAMETYKLTHASSTRKAVALQLTFVEHTTEAIDFSTKPDKSVKSKLQGLVDAFKKIDSAIDAVEATIFAARTLKNTVKALLEDYKAAYAKLSGSMNKTFNKGGSIPALTPVNEGGLLDENGNIITGGTTVVASPNDPFQNLPIELTTESTATALAIEDMQKQTQSVMNQLTEIIIQLEDIGDGRGSLEFYDNILSLRETSIALQDAFETGKQSSQVRIIEYTVPRIMTVREVAFANGIPVDNAFEILQLNHELDSANFIEKDTTLVLAVS